MAWDIGYMGTCSRCGEHIHAFYEDHAGTTGVWLRCPQCRRADAVAVADEKVAEFWNEPHPCPVCGSERQRWDASTCPRCGQEDCAEFIYMPD